jgi:hypothetical protein
VCACVREARFLTAGAETAPPSCRRYEEQAIYGDATVAIVPQVLQELGGYCRAGPPAHPTAASPSDA